MVLDSVMNLTAPDTEIYKELKEISIRRVDDTEHELKLLKKNWLKEINFYSIGLYKQHCSIQFNF
jgi:hypothetical protein